VTYVYLLRSVPFRDRIYFGLTHNVRRRLAEHNAGRSPHTAKFRPWEIVTVIAFRDDSRAADFERYLKTGSGAAFATRHLW